VRLFLSLVNLVAARKGETSFKLVTRNDVTEDLLMLSDEGRTLLTLINKSRISDEEISDTVADSIALFLPHRQVTQSGNVPVAFRWGTPVIARDLPGFSQHVAHKETGYLVPREVTPSQLLTAVRYVKNNFFRLSQNARAFFEDTFSESNWEKYYGWLS
jgi:glycosyltransferase involved in cell wall biosynthesis